MSTFLELCQGVAREGGIGDGESAISAVTGQVGENQRVVNYVKRAWREIQVMHQHSGLYWRWMRVGFTLTTVASTSEYAYSSSAIVDDLTATQIARFRNWMIKDPENPVKCYLQSAGVGTEHYLSYMDWDDFAYMYRIGTQNDGPPAHVSISPQNKIVIGPAPDAVYIITGDFIRGIQDLAANSDTPDMPADFHDTIIFKALMKFGIYENSQESTLLGETDYDFWIGALEGDQLSEIPTADPLC